MSGRATDWKVEVVLQQPTVNYCSVVCCAPDGRIFLAEDSFSAQQAYDWGLVAKIVPEAELKAATRQFAERLAQNPPAAIAGTKSLVYQALVTPTRLQLDAEQEKIIDAMHTDDFRTAVKKFTSRGK